MKLTDKKILNLLPRDKRYLVADGQSLFIRVATNGKKYWYFQYSWFAKEQGLSFGKYPEISILEARELAFEARRMKQQGVNPIEHRKMQKALVRFDSNNTFEKVAREWLDIKSETWAKDYRRLVHSILEKDILPKLGNRPINNILTPDVLAVVRSVEKRQSLAISRKVARICNRIFVYGIAAGLVKNNPAETITKIIRNYKIKHHAYLTPMEIPPFLDNIESWHGLEQTKNALKFMMLTFVRSKELREAKWNEIDFDREEWRIPAFRMKMGIPHIVPLSKQAIGILKRQQDFKFGKNAYVFNAPRLKNRPIGETTLINLIWKMGYGGRLTIHGIRATASTTINESGLFLSDAIDRQLSHREPNKIRRAYNHSQHIDLRRRMMQWWGDYLSKSGLIVPGMTIVEDQVPEIEDKVPSSSNWLSLWTGFWQP